MYTRLGIIVASTNREIDFFLRENRLNPHCFGRATREEYLRGIPRDMLIFVLNRNRLSYDFRSFIESNFF